MQKSAVQALQSGIIAYDQRHGYRGPEQTGLAEAEWQRLLRQNADLRQPGAGHSH